MIIHQKFLVQTYSTYPRRLPNFVKTQSCWRSKYWTPRRASRSGVAAPDAVMPWCVRVCQRIRIARPSPKRATSNRVFVIRADKEGGSQRVLRLRMHAPYQRAPEKVFYPCTGLPLTPSRAARARTARRAPLRMDVFYCYHNLLIY